MTAIPPFLRFSDVLSVAKARNASDIHFVPRIAPVLRIDGRLEPLAGQPVTLSELQELIGRLFPESARARLMEQGDVTTTLRDDEQGTLRVHASAANNDLSLAVRLLAKVVPSLATLHLPPVIESFIDRSHGLVIISGPTGSGKSTSLAALIGRLNATQSRRIVCIEDPIEYRHESKRSIVTQREVGADVPTFSAAILGALRSDADVLVIGEMRDPATIQAALLAAETGHLVLATLHTGDAPQTIDRIVGVFSGDAQAQARAQLAAALIGIVCQRLVPRAHAPGRRVATEVLIGNDAVRSLIRERKTFQMRNVMLTARQQGMHTLEHHLAELVKDREIDLQEARRHTDRAGEIASIGGALL